MARPTKQGLEYMPIDVVFDDKVLLYLAEKESFGLAVLITAWQLIYRDEGYFAPQGDDFCLAIKMRIAGELSGIHECIQACLGRNIFDRGMSDRHHILTSRGIQRRYFEAVKKRRAVECVPAYLLVSPGDYPNLTNEGIFLTHSPKKGGVMSPETTVNSPETPIKVELTPQAAGLIPPKGAETPQAAGLIPPKAEFTPQSKVKESKVKKELHCEGSHQKPDATPSRDTAHRILDFLNSKTGKNYRAFEGLNGKRKPTANLELVLARLRDGKTEDDLRGVIARKAREWKGDAQMEKYLRPATLFNRTKCEQYVGEQEGPSA